MAPAISYSDGSYAIGVAATVVIAGDDAGFVEVEPAVELIQPKPQESCEEPSRQPRGMRPRVPRDDKTYSGM